MAFTKIIFYVLKKVLSNLKKHFTCHYLYYFKLFKPNVDQSRVALVVAFVFHIATIF